MKNIFADKSMLIQIRPVATTDSAAIAALYNRYVCDAVTTFEEAPRSPQEIEERIATISANYPYLALIRGETLIGYAYGTAFRGRSAYRFTVETTVYLDASEMGKGYGTKLYSELLSALAERGFKTAIGVIALPNPASVRLHEKLGFVQVAHLHNVGWKFEQWIDTGYWQIELSPVGEGIHSR